MASNTFGTMILSGVLLALLAACGEAVPAPTTSSTGAAASVAPPSASVVAASTSSIAPVPSSAPASSSSSQPAAPSAAASARQSGSSVSASAAAAQPPMTVQVVAVANVGNILADPRGMALYTYDKDQKGVSNCSDTCALTWPPLIAFGPSYGPRELSGVFDVITRGDGKKQITWNGMPLYTYSADTKPGETKGNGFGGAWHIVSAGSAAVPSVISASAAAAAPTTVQVMTDPKLGKILLDPRGMTLYTYDKDQKGVSNCTDACALTWPPLIAFGPSFGPPGVSGALDVISRADGKKQVTWNGLPLYTYSQDTQPSDTRGNGFGGVWKVVPAA